MKPRNYSLFFIIMLLANVTTTALAGTLIYGMLSGVLPHQLVYVTLQHQSPATTPAGHPQERTITPGRGKPAGGNTGLAAIPIPDPAKVLLFCRQIQEAYTGGSTRQETSPRKGDKLLPLVDKRNRPARQRSEQVFF